MNEKEIKAGADELSVMTEKWMRLERKTLKQREAAEQFYEKKLLKLIENDSLQGLLYGCFSESLAYCSR